MRIVIDTNIWLSALISSDTRKRLKIILSQPEVEIIGTDALIEELREVAMRPKFRKYVTKAQATSFLNLIIDRLDIISPPHSEISVCRDPNDDFLLALCKDGDIDFLITGDKDLLSLDPFEKTRIVSLGDFEQTLQ